MKKVVSESEVAHLWANQLQDEARKSNNSFYFNGRTIYSYGIHFPIAVINKDDSNIVYFTTRDYSVTTSGHKSTARQAINGKQLIYCKNPDEAATGYHSDNIANFENRAKEIAKHLPNSRKPEIYLNQIASVCVELNIYMGHFNLKLENYALTYIFIKSKTGTTEATEQEKINQEIAEKARIEKNKKQHAKELKEFRAFKRDRLYIHNSFDFLRLNTETNRIETSQRVEIPLKTAQTLYKAILKTIQTGKCQVCGKNFMNAYEINDINKDFIVVGCHKITIKEINKIAKLLNW